MRLYVGTPAPSERLVALVTFVLKVYVPMWFLIRKQSSCTEGSHHLMRMIQLTRYLPQAQRAVVDSVIQQNCYFRHHENILISMVTNDDVEIRKKGLTLILKSREVSTKGKKICAFRKPKINFEAESYVDMINWKDTVLTSPPILRNISSQHISDYLSQDIPLKLDIPKYPAHTQSVERIGLHLAIRNHYF